MVRADTTLSLVQAQHVRQLRELQERVGDSCRGEVEQLQVRLVEEQRRSRQLEETLRVQAQQSNSQISVKQVKTRLWHASGCEFLKVVEIKTLFFLIIQYKSKLLFTFLLKT